jgi:hypothetical protein
VAAGLVALLVLNVRSFTLTCDTAHPRAGVPFNVTLTVQVSQNVPELPDVYLPAFFGPQELGDERQIHHGHDGTLYRETLRLVAAAAGPVHIGSAYLDAIDARDGKPKRFISNALDLNAGPAPVARTGVRFFETAAIALAALLTFAFARRPARRRREAVSIKPVPVVNGIAEAIAQLRDRRDRKAVFDLRAQLWESAGARQGETLQDVLARPKAVDRNVRRMLILIEEAAFIEEARLEDAVARILEDTA